LFTEIRVFFASIFHSINSIFLLRLILS